QPFSPDFFDALPAVKLPRTRQRSKPVMIFRSALRTLLKTPFITLVAVASLALGIGANTAIYSIFDQVLRRPLPVSEPRRLVNFGAPAPKPGSTSCNQAGDCDA